MGTGKSRDDASRDSGDRPRRRCENRAAAWGAWKVPDRVNKSTESVRMSLVHHRRSQQKMPCWKGCSSEIDRLCRMKRVGCAIQYTLKRVSTTNLVVVKEHVQKGQFNELCRGEDTRWKVSGQRTLLGWWYTLNRASSTDFVGELVHVKRSQFSRPCRGEGRLHVERGQFKDLVRLKVHLERSQFNRPCQGKGTLWKRPVQQTLSRWRYTLKGVSSSDLVKVKVGYSLKGSSSTGFVQAKVPAERGQFIRSCEGEGRLLVERVQLNRRMYTMKGVSSSDLVMVKIGYSLKRVQFNRPCSGEGTRWKGSVQQALYRRRYTLLKD